MPLFPASNANVSGVSALPPHPLVLPNCCVWYADNCSEADYYSPMAGDYDLSRINVSVNPHFAALQTGRGTMYAGSITGTTTVPVEKTF